MVTPTTAYQKFERFANDSWATMPSERPFHSESVSDTHIDFEDIPQTRSAEHGSAHDPNHKRSVDAETTPFVGPSSPVER